MGHAYYSVASTAKLYILLSHDIIHKHVRLIPPISAEHLCLQRCNYRIRVLPVGLVYNARGTHSYIYRAPPRTFRRDERRNNAATKHVERTEILYSVPMKSTLYLLGITQSEINRF